MLFIFKKFHQNHLFQLPERPYRNSLGQCLVVFSFPFDKCDPDCALLSSLGDIFPPLPTFLQPRRIISPKCCAFSSFKISLRFQIFWHSILYVLTGCICLVFNCFSKINLLDKVLSHILHLNCLKWIAFTWWAFLFLTLNFFMHSMSLTLLCKAFLCSLRNCCLVVAWAHSLQWNITLAFKLEVLSLHPAYIQRQTKRLVRGCENFVLALA